MSSSMVRGYWVAGALASLQAATGEETRDRVLQRASGQASAGRAGPLAPGEWVPRALLTEVLRAVASATQPNVYDALAECGDSIAGFACTSFLDIVTGLLTVELLAKKLPRLWRLDHQDSVGVQVELTLVESRARVVATGIGSFDHAGPLYAGWLGHVFGRTIGAPVRVKHQGWAVESPAADRLEWEIQWA
jgi:hypothetical protein